MLRNRVIKVTLDKKEKDPSEKVEPKTFEDKADVVLERLQVIGVQLFWGMCIYIWLDTRRQVKVEEAKHFNQ